MFEHNGIQTGFADINGSSLYYEVAGDGLALVLAHAGIADRRMWDDQYPSDWVKWFFKPPGGQRPANLHVRVAGHANQRYALLFRDYLRAHPVTAHACGELKRRLAQNLAHPDTYPDVKDPAVNLIYLAAEDWAVVTHWQPGISGG